MKFLVDMNLSPEWLGVLSQQGWTAVHWQAMGQATAPDQVLLDWARKQQTIVLTQDLDFAQLLYQTQASGPSVVLLRLQDELNPVQRTRICRALAMAESALETGAILVITEGRVRLHRLPIEGQTH